MKAAPKGEEGRRRRAVEVLSGPDPWNKQRTGLAGVAIEGKTHRLRPEGFARDPLSGDLKDFWMPAVRLSSGLRGHAHANRVNY
jgi:hypothetical protein